MTPEKNKRKELLRFIDQKTFDPVLHLPLETYSGADRKHFQSVRKLMLEEKRKLHAYSSPIDIKEIFLNTLHTDCVLGRDDKQDLYGQWSTLTEVKDRFEILCRKLKI